MATLAHVPVSKYNSFPSAPHAWRRIAKCIAMYGGEFNNELYQQLLAQQQCVPAVAALQSQGVVLSAATCNHWAFELCGSFEVTHPRYTPPKGSELPQATVLYNALMELFDE